MQKKVLARIMNVIETAGLEAIQISNWSNTGHISIQDPNEIGEIGSVRYDFQNSWATMNLSITIQGVKVLSQPPRQGYYDFYMNYTAGDKYKAFERVLQAQVEKLATEVTA